MKYKVFALKDSAAQAFGAPIFHPSTGALLRNFSDQVNGKGGERGPLSEHPEDFELYELGMFDDADASFQLLPTPSLVSRMKDLVRG